MEYAIYSYTDILDRAASVGVDIAFFNNREKVVITGQALREEYRLDHVAGPDPNNPWGETYYRKV